MTLRSIPTLSVLALAALFWIVPSIGTQGIGTLGQRASHADRTLVEVGIASDLTLADAAVEAALPN